MILLLDTSTPTCHLTLVVKDVRNEFSWQADRELARGLIGFIEESLESLDFTWRDIQGIGVFEGPGSFTGLRIGMAVMNTLADAEAIPVVGEREEGWQDRAIDRLKRGDNDQIVLPYYGGEANITSPRK